MQRVKDFIRNKRVWAVCLINLVFIETVTGTAYASEYKRSIRNILEQMIDIIGTIFQCVGVVLTVYSVGQLLLAFKNEDADSKSRASTQLVVGVALIAMPAIIKSLNIIGMIG